MPSNSYICLDYILSVYLSLSHVFIVCNYLQDRNDFTPVFEKSAYTADRLLETVFPGTPVLTVKATDGDPEVSVREPQYSQ